MRAATSGDIRQTAESRIRTAPTIPHMLGLSGRFGRSEEHTSELQSLAYLVCRLLLEKKNKNDYITIQLSNVTECAASLYIYDLVLSPSYYTQSICSLTLPITMNTHLPAFQFAHTPHT